MSTTQEQPKKSVRDYLDALVWDRVPRVERWLVDYAGADDTPYVRSVARAMLVAAVRRARHPGCKLDQMPIFEGTQGCGKSTALRVLAIDDAWFIDQPLGTEMRQVIEATAGKWIVEASELSAMGAGDVAALKAVLSRTVDEARLPYQRDVTRAPRQFVIVGTTSATDYLRDATGNRRFWPVRVDRFDVEHLRADRDQLWAEAAAIEATGAAIHFPDAATAAAHEAHSCGTDPLVDVLSRALGDRTGKLRVPDAYLICGIQAGEASQSQVDRLGRSMRELGWERQRCQLDGGLTHVYVRGTAEQRDAELVVEYDAQARSVRVVLAAPGH